MEKIEHSNKRLFGEHRAILSVGLSGDEKRILLDDVESLFGDVKVIFGTKKDLNARLSEIFSHEHRYGENESFDVPKTIITSGLTESELLDFMKHIRRSIKEIKLMAVLTPTSNQWKLKELLAELIMEAKAMEKRKKGK